MNKEMKVETKKEENIKKKILFSIYILFILLLTTAIYIYSLIGDVKNSMDIFNIWLSENTGKIISLFGLYIIIALSISFLNFLIFWIGFPLVLLIGGIIGGYDIFDNLTEAIQLFNKILSTNIGNFVVLLGIYLSVLLGGILNKINYIVYGIPLSFIVGFLLNLYIR